MSRAALVCLLLVLPAIAGDRIETDATMRKLYDRKTGLHYKIRDKVAAKTVNWTDLRQQTREYISLAEPLHNNKPPRGDVKDWKIAVDEFLKDVKALDKAADDKDLPTAEKLMKKLSERCTACHDAHR